MLSQILDAGVEFVPFYVAKNKFQLDLAYKIPWHFLCTMVFKLEIPLTNNMADRFRDWSLPISTMNWWTAKTKIFYATLMKRSDMSIKCNLKWGMQKDQDWWSNQLSRSWASTLDFKAWGSLPLGALLKESSVTDGKCCRCKKKHESCKHAFWYCEIVQEWWH